MKNLSIIIPVFKVELFIYKCVNSILSQNINHHLYEVIIVNDGTPDKSIEKIQQFLLYDNVVLINQENKGLSEARNTGLKAARGQYVWFVDSDDWLLPNALSDVFKSIKNSPDTPVFSTILEMNIENRQPFWEYTPQYHQLSGKEYLRKRYKQGASQRFIFRKDFLEQYQLLFYPRILHEDGLFGYKMLYLAKEVVILPNPVYAYRIRTNGSIMSSISIKSANDLLFIHKELITFCKTITKESDKIWFRLIIYNIIKDLFSFCRNIISSHEFKSFYEKNRSYINKESIYYLKHGGSPLLALRILFFPISYWKIRLKAKRILTFNKHQ